jgi:hypothetical protein
MLGDNSKEALGLTLNYNKAPDASWNSGVSRVVALEKAGER